MPIVSPLLLKSAIRNYEPWGLLHGAMSIRSGLEQRDDAEWLTLIAEKGRELARASDSQLQAFSMHLKEVARGGADLEAYLVDSFALGREASRRVLGLFHYDVQILGGLAICRGTIAEMATGEGKTLVQSLAAYTRSLAGNGVHVATANSYLAERDHAFAVPLFEFLGVRSALLPERVSGPQKRAAYEAEVTYGTGTEFGFDYLRDQVELMRLPSLAPGESYRRGVLGLGARTETALSQRVLPFAIIDEIDSVLIDEASTPLVISEGGGGEHPTPHLFEVADHFATKFEENEDFQIDRRSRSFEWREKGLALLEEGSDEIPWDLLRRPWQIYLENSLRARHLFQRDIDYVVEEESKKVVIVDPNTGRVREGSSWREGLHQAVECLERVPITAESSPIASISRQRFYRLYEGLGGMTGTASEAAGEFWRFYRLPVTQIARNRPSRARSYPPRIFRTFVEKWSAISDELRFRQDMGQPVLVGCSSIEESELGSRALTKAGLEHTLLNANTAAKEAEIIAAAGAPRKITLATNIAGRGTHIALSELALLAGGLHVIATGFDSSKRIDRQLTGRSARQGEPGSHQFFLGGEDELLVRYCPADSEKLSNTKNADSEGEVKAGSWIRVFDRAQRLSERAEYEQRVAQFHHNELINEVKEILT